MVMLNINLMRMKRSRNKSNFISMVYSLSQSNLHRITFSLLIVLTLISTISAQVEINQGTATFSISAPSSGISPSAYIYENENKIATISLCQESRCTGNIQAEYISQTPGKYKLVYYDFYDFKWQEIEFTITQTQAQEAQQLSEQQTQSNNQQNPQSQNQEASMPKKIFVTSLCRISNLFSRNGYIECRDNYI